MGLLFHLPTNRESPEQKQGTVCGKMPSENSQNSTLGEQPIIFSAIDRIAYLTGAGAPARSEVQVQVSLRPGGQRVRDPVRAESLHGPLGRP